ncbi:MAG: tRNA epoxyqueuosine(34) reductase QueG [Deltaproteobacteria bacterium]|nr:tRNA epoxyqueuosine(34) reductase QueG [Deltaproteobacteria bacterium]
MISKEEICAYANAINIDLIGFTDTRPLKLNYMVFKAWIESGYAGKLSWLYNNPLKRFDPRLVFPDGETIISIGISYFKEDNLESLLISRYARAKDYHRVLKDKLKMLYKFMKKEDPGLKARIFVDSAPIAEKAIAQKAGLGWQGRNSLLVNERLGSWIFLGELIINKKYPIDTPCYDRCGDCMACIEACPTGAIRQDRTIDARLCISYLTIEYKGEFKKEDQIRQHGMLFGCDICQEVCPWNRRPIPTREPDFMNTNELSKYPIEKLALIREEEFRSATHDTALKRITYKQFKRNLAGIEIPQKPIH